MRLEPVGFVAHERSQRAWILRYGVLLALASLLGNTLQNSFSFEPRASIAYVQWAIALALNLVGIFWWAGGAQFARRPWIDLAVTLPMILWMEGITTAATTQSGVTGWAPAAVITANYTLTVAFASLFFPANIRAYVLWFVGHAALFAWTLFRAHAPWIEMSLGWGVYLPVALIGIYSSWAIDRKGWANFQLAQSLAEEKSKSDEMLFSILPEEVAGRLRAGEAIADSFSDATVVFVDLVGSSQLARNLSPKHFLSTLNDVFSIADAAAVRFGVEKVKTIGDAYLAVAGGRTGADAAAALGFAKQVVAEVETLARQRQLDLGVRVGVHTGPVVGGVIGQTRATYDYWGDTMNVAARVEAAANPGGISVTKQTYYATRDHTEYFPPRTVMLKGIGDTQIYDLAI